MSILEAVQLSKKLSHGARLKWSKQYWPGKSASVPRDGGTGPWSKLQQSMALQK